jgi:hypothetical protein
MTIYIQTYRRGQRAGTDQVTAVEAVKRALASRPYRRDVGRAPLGDASSCDQRTHQQNKSTAGEALKDCGNGQVARAPVPIQHQHVHRFIIHTPVWTDRRSGNRPAPARARVLLHAGKSSPPNLEPVEGRAYQWSGNKVRKCRNGVGDYPLSAPIAFHTPPRFKAFC